MKPNFLDVQPEVTRIVRAFLIESFLRWTFFFQYKQETLFLAVYILDKYLSACPVSKTTLQALCLTILFIAAKFEEVKMIRLNSILKSVHTTIEPEKIFALEKKVLQILDFKLTSISPFDFLKRIYHVTGTSIEKYPLSCYLLESFLFDSTNSCYAASDRAAAAFFLTMKLQKIGFNKERLKRYLSFDEEKVFLAQKQMLMNLNYLEINDFNSLKVKYKNHDFVAQKIKAEINIVKNL